MKCVAGTQGHPNWKLLPIISLPILSNWGIQPAPGTNDKYFQTVEFQKTTPPSVIEFVVDGQTFKVKEDLVQLGGGDVEVSGCNCFCIGYGSRADFEQS
jgi:hypothetical protein